MFYMGNDFINLRGGKEKEIIKIPNQIINGKLEPLKSKQS